jgi:hypothetical protein
MTRNVLLVLVKSRKDSAPKVQSILTAWGCFIKTRLGLHGGTLDECTDDGLLFLELVGDAEKHAEMARKLNLLSGVSAQLVTLTVQD